MCFTRSEQDLYLLYQTVTQDKIYDVNRLCTITIRRSYHSIPVLHAWAEKLSTHPTPPFLYKTYLVVPRHLIWDCDVDLYHVYDINYSNIEKIYKINVFLIILIYFV